MQTREKPLTVKQTFKVSELPSALQKALHAEPDAKVIVHAKIVEDHPSEKRGKDHWKHVAEQAAREAPLKGKSEEFIARCREFREGFTFDRNHDPVTK